METDSRMAERKWPASHTLPFDRRQINTAGLDRNFSADFILVSSFTWITYRIGKVGPTVPNAARIDDGSGQQAILWYK